MRRTALILLLGSAASGFAQHWEGSVNLTFSSNYAVVRSAGDVKFYAASGYLAPNAPLDGEHKIHQVLPPVNYIVPVSGNAQYAGLVEAPAEAGACYWASLNASTGAWNYSETTPQQCAPQPPPPSSACGTNGTLCERSEFCPLILDLNGDGIHTTGLDDSVRFWIDLNGQIETTAWTDPTTEEAFLWVDLNHDLKAQPTELFGSRMVAPNGEYHAQGYEALEKYDHPDFGGDGDGQITPHDAIWPHLKLWVDRNHDAVTQPAEISVLSSHRIVALNLSHWTGDDYDASGNELYIVGSYVIRWQGKETVQRLMADIEFAYVAN